MYSFAQRADTEVLDEPFYAFYLLESGAEHPGREHVMQSLPSTEADVRTLIQNKLTKPVLFIKNMAHHLELLRTPTIAGAIDIFLIRDPQQIIASYAEVIAMPKMRDIGIEYQFQLFSQLQNSGLKPI